ncbi:zinc-binding alcohol dehydrogenase family protein [Geomicrobium sediminis]|uniref:Zinc-type alcohol dehydrogenase-like protein n=1 Tax=Geomicrobium sediminis TaxID=1347788 RepID=A0ABS2P9M6_9BACL|nr:zinc-binding alcohol dehydrogenase family protein [Geomicrobium sediminis]MBM7632105.1 zinc-binding alcohol dehydrogenase family protein [Geomicrobium sediminis]
MKAVGFYKGSQLQDVSVENPKATGRNLIVSVQAVSVNPVDTKQFEVGTESEEHPRVLGYDASGIVEEVGEEVTLFAPGDHVYYAGDVTKAGTNSEYHLVDERIVGKKPESLSFGEAAAMPLTTITAYEGLFDRLDISKTIEDNKGKQILIVGGAGGVGSIAIQLAKTAGLHVVATASRAKTSEWVKHLGADVVINHQQPLDEQLKKHDVDYVFCCTHLTTHWEAICEVVAPEGRIVSIVSEEKVDLNLLKTKSVTFCYEFMFTRAMYETETMIKQHHLLNEVSELIDQGEIQHTMTEIHSPLNAKTVAKAHEKLQSQSMIGKLVIEMKN